MRSPDAVVPPDTFAVDPALPSPIPNDPAGTVLTVGTFDGVHRGHWAVLREIVQRARSTDRRSALVTFDPHPLKVVRPAAAPPMLTSRTEKKEILAETGLSYAVFLPFTPVLQGYSARRFVEEILLGRLRMHELVIGYDHGFGRDREGSVDTLRELGVELGFRVDVVGPVSPDGAEEPISSTRIRRALSEGDVVGAAHGLGRPYAVRGSVVRGDGRGRSLGFPTANIAVDDPDKMLPLEGVYAAWGWIDSERVAGVVHLGPRPTFGATLPTIELHLLDWDGDLYSREVRVEFCARLRGIESFRSPAELIAAIERDVRAAEAVLRSSGGMTACARARTSLS